MAVTMNLKGTSNPTFKVGNASDGGAQLGYVDFNTTATVADAVGRMKWNSGDGTLDIGLAGGQSTLQVGQELLVRIKNNTGSTLTDGQVVYVTGAQGQRTTVALADADIEASSAATIGVVTETIADAAEGFVTLAGLVRNVNTIAWAEGTPLYLSSTAGSLTSVKPVPPKHAVRVGWVVRAHASAGSILVHIQNGYELDELHDVLISSPANGSTLYYDQASALWKNSTDLVWDGTNNRLGIGTTTPLSQLHVNRNAAAIPSYDAGTNESAINITAEDNRTAKFQTFAFNSGSNVLRFNYARGSASAPLYPTTLSSLGSISWRGWDENTSTWLGGATIAAQPDADWNATTRDTAIRFFTTKGTTASEKIRISSSGNLLIGTTTDIGYKLLVNGNTKTNDLYVSNAAFSNGLALTSYNALINVADGSGVQAGAHIRFRDGLDGGGNQVCDAIIIDDLGDPGIGDRTATYGGLIVKDSFETEVTSNFSQLTNKKLSVGGKANDVGGLGGTVAATLNIDLSDALDDTSGSGLIYDSGGVVFNHVTDVPAVTGMPLDKSYRFKGLTNDVLIKDGVWTSGTLTTQDLSANYFGDATDAKFVISNKGNDSDYGGDPLVGGSVVFDNQILYGNDPCPKAYRFKGLTNDVLIKDGVWTSGNILINTATDNAVHKLQVNGSSTMKGIALSTRTVTASTTATVNDFTIRCNASSADITVTLPAASTVTGSVFIIKKVDSTLSIVTLVPNASEVVDGQNTMSIYSQYDAVTIQSNGSSWDVI